MMVPLDIAVMLLKAGRQVSDHSAPASEQMLANLVTDYPGLPWRIAFEGLAAEQDGYQFARRVLTSMKLL